MPFKTLMGLTPLGWAILILANIPVYLVLVRVWFRDRDDFMEAIRYMLTPDSISLLRGEYGDDRWARFKFFLWLGSCAVCVYFEADFIQYMMRRSAE